MHETAVTNSRFRAFTKLSEERPKEELINNPLAKLKLLSLHLTRTESTKDLSREFFQELEN